MAEHLCIAQVPLFNHLPIEAQQEIMNLTHHHIYKKNELVFQPGDENLYIIASGSIKVYQLSISGKEHLLRVLKEGDYEGEKQLFNIKRYPLWTSSRRNGNMYANSTSISPGSFRKSIHCHQTLRTISKENSSVRKTSTVSLNGTCRRTTCSLLVADLS